MGEDAESPWTPEHQAATFIAKLRRKFPDRQLYPVKRGNLASQWEFVADLSRLADADTQKHPEKSYVPPPLTPLVAAVMRTQLIRFYPFMGEHLYFGDGPGVWGEKGEIAPACIGAGGHEEVYFVLQGGPFYSGAPWLPGQVTCTLTTHDPDEAAAEAERLLAGWAWSGQQSPAAPGFVLAAKASRPGAPVGGVPRNWLAASMLREGATASDH
jgi:hypothetical protein